ncbi:hypothetical protein [Paenibacillus sp. FJAT-27812]|uniref:hypothetical protein n=1 Tax=Paenibacillus sp. FJAT-27812 TaxID=1684143 RepID=UPI0006A7B2F6|nr:hypothetical protein [Paenibacillus sp. FJAT-27812]
MCRKDYPRRRIIFTGSRILKWITGILELILAIPIIGGSIVISSWYSALGVMLILHIVAFVLSSKNNEPKYGSAVGIVTSLLAWIPFLGWVLHLVSAILIMVTAAQRGKGNAQNFNS